jgi:TM2 domain-containing membrane protein YozV
MYCGKCGSQLNEGSAFCPRCGVRVAPVAAETAADASPKSRLATSLLAWFLGEFGVHRFYTGKVGTAVIMLIMGIAGGICWLGGFFGALVTDGAGPIWSLLVVGALLYLAAWIWKTVDFVIAVTGNFKDSQGRIIKKW